MIPYRYFIIYDIILSIYGIKFFPKPKLQLFYISNPENNKGPSIKDVHKI